MNFAFDQKELVKWFKSEKRDLPWRHNPTPYQVWISEVMLQQTQIATVLPYYERWMIHFPTLEHLAKAPIEEVIKLWEGLGYYSRARSLHTGANYILEKLNGIIPSDPHLLAQIKGIGPYTLGAILSFAFHKRWPAVDGNVIRVLSRYFMIEEDVAQTKTQRTIRDIAEKILPFDEPWVMVEALIELGATICQRVPKCERCPVQKNCKAYLHDKAYQLPNKTKKDSTHFLFRAVAVVKSHDKFLVRQVKEGEIMSGLHEFPYLETHKEKCHFLELQQWLESQLSIKSTLIKTLPAVSHSFTKYQAKLFPFYLECEKPLQIKDYKWLCLTELKKAAFPSGHRHICATLFT